MTFQIKVLIVEQHALLSDQIRQIIWSGPGLELIGEASNPDQALALLADRMPDVIIMDMHLRDMCGLDAIRILRTRARQAKVILLTDQDEVRYQRAAEGSGVHTCLRKDLIAQALVMSVRNMFETSPSDESQGDKSLLMKERT